MNKREIGAKKEELACSFLRQNGYVILEQNYRCKTGEIDIIAKDGVYLVFLEVKYRKNTDMGTPFEAINRKKQQTIRKVARYYLYQNHIGEDCPIRFDAVGILGEAIELVKDAF